MTPGAGTPAESKAAGFSLPIQIVEAAGITAWLVEDHAVPADGRPAGWSGKARDQKARPAWPRGVSSARRALAAARARTRSTASASSRGSAMASRASRTASGRASASARKPPSK